MAVSLACFSGTASAHTTSFNQKAASYVETFIGRVPYVYGGTSPSSGFDCSGLAQYVYRHFGKSIPRTAEAQFLRFRRESKRAAWGGDLVFFHVDSDPNSYVYHVAIYEGGNRMVSAIDEAEGIGRQTIWSPDVTFGTMRLIQQPDLLCELYPRRRRARMKDGLFLEMIGLPHSIKETGHRHVSYHGVHSRRANRYLRTHH